jgi:beta-1,4-mannosyltransferase
VLTSMPGRDQSTEGWIAETFAALARIPVDGPEPVVWPFAPYYSGNPFQTLLYSGFAERAMVAAPTFRGEDLLRITADWPADLPLVVHLHWLNQVLAKARTPVEAGAALDAHARLLDRLKARGARLVWTVHNILPHDTRFEAEEVRLRQDVIDRVDLVHVMSPRTPELTRPWFDLPEDRVYHCDHPGYQGVYPDWISRVDARRRLRVPDGATALLLTGAIKPYKGLLETFEAVDEVSRERPGSIVLLVAGKPDDAPETAEFVARAAQHPAVRLLPGQVPDVDIQVLMRACDAVALPYRRSLNSGVLALALTWGRPVLLPDNSGSVPVISTPTGPAGVVYPADTPGALTEAVRSTLTWDAEKLTAAAALAGRRIDRATVAARFADDLRAWADDEAPGRLAPDPSASPGSAAVPDPSASPGSAAVPDLSASPGSAAVPDLSASPGSAAAPDPSEEVAR